MALSCSSYTTLFSTNVGSHMWRMETPASDIDLITVNQVDTMSILRGISIQSTSPDKKYRRSDGVEVDEKIMEIGHLVNQLIKGNVNAIWAVCTPLVVKKHVSLYELQELVLRNISKASYHSIRGMAISQMLDIEKRRDVMPQGKAARTSIRTAQFGITFLEQGLIAFESYPLDWNPTKEDCEIAISRLDRAHERSALPDTPNEDEFRDYLYQVRVENMSSKW